jgi:hypothetical protein
MLISHSPFWKEIGVRIREDDGSLKVVQGYRKGTVWGRVEYDENGKPTEPLFGTFSRASDLKMKLGTAVRKTGTRVLDRTMLTSIITRDGVAIGATALNTRTGKFLVLKAKAILLATGAGKQAVSISVVTVSQSLVLYFNLPRERWGRSCQCI